MKNYFVLDELEEEMRDAKMFSRRFEMLYTFKLNNLKELCGRLPNDDEIFFI